MHQSTYQNLPVEALQDLLTDGVKKLLSSYDLKEIGLIEFKANKKYVEGLIALIEEKKKESLKTA
jgi:hypothetical protein